MTYSCDTLKKKTEEKDVVVEEVKEKTEEEEETVLDLLPENFDTHSDCLKEWKHKERQILKKDYEYIKRMKDGADGVIYVIAKVNPDGAVYETQIQKLKTTVKDTKILNMAKDIVERFEFEPSDTAPKYDCGLIKFNLTTM